MKPSQIIDLDAEVQSLQDAEEAHRLQMQHNNIETVEYIDDLYPSHFDEHDIVRCEIQEAIQSGDWDRARQLASLIDITLQ